MIGATLIVGLGSPCGDEQATWLLADRVAWELAKLNELRDEQVLLGNDPSQMLECLHGVARLVVLDTCEPGAGDQPLTLGQSRRFLWPAVLPSSRHNQSTNPDAAAKSIAETLKMAEQLNRLPGCVWVWTIAAKSSSEAEGISSEVENCLPKLADRIVKELTSLIACEEESLPGDVVCSPIEVQ